VICSVVALSADFQPVTLQGQMAYRIAQPEQAAALLDYSVDGDADAYRSEDPERP
jgi:hypothetical protein